MGNNVSKEQTVSARQADLYTFLMKHHSSNFKTEGDSIRPVDNHSISIRKGYNGYKDFSTGETGNSIDFLKNYMGYTFVEAVQALSDTSVSASAPIHHVIYKRYIKIYLPKNAKITRSIMCITKDNKPWKTIVFRDYLYFFEKNYILIF